MDIIKSIVKYKLGNTKFIGAVVVGSLVGGTFVNVSAKNFVDGNHRLLPGRFISLKPVNVHSFLGTPFRWGGSFRNVAKVHSGFGRIPVNWKLSKPLDRSGYYFQTGRSYAVPSHRNDPRGNVSFRGHSQPEGISVKASSGSRPSKSATLTPQEIRNLSRDDTLNLLLSPNRRDRITPDIIRGLTPRQFRRICYGNGYCLIFSNRKLRNAVSPQQIAAVDPSYVDEMQLHKLNSKQLSAVTPQQLLRLGTGDIIPRYRPIMLKKVKKIEKKFDSRQRKAFKIAERRILNGRR